MATGETDESLQAAGFVPIEEMQDEGADDEDGSLCPPPQAFAGGGGIRIAPTQLASGRVQVKLWSTSEDTKSGAGFQCVHDLAKNIFFAKLGIIEGAHADDEDGEAIKGAITTLLDVAEACSSQKICLGLAPEHVGCAELICSLLYLGFQVVPSRKSPFVNTALLLDFDMVWPGDGPGASDHTCTCTSECSTSAEDDIFGNGSLESD